MNQVLEPRIHHPQAIENKTMIDEAAKVIVDLLREIDCIDFSDFDSATNTIYIKYYVRVSKGISPKITPN